MAGCAAVDLLPDGWCRPACDVPVGWALAPGVRLAASPRRARRQAASAGQCREVPLPGSRQHDSARASCQASRSEAEAHALVAVARARAHREVLARIAAAASAPAEEARARAAAEVRAARARLEAGVPALKCRAAALLAQVEAEARLREQSQASAAEAKTLAAHFDLAAAVFPSTLGASVEVSSFAEAASESEWELLAEDALGGSRLLEGRWELVA